MTTMRKWCLAVLVPAVLSFGCLDGPEAGPSEKTAGEVQEGTVQQGLATFTGTVVSSSGSPIAGATVNINGINRTTDTAGKYAVVLNDATGYILSVSRSGFAPTTEYLQGGQLNNRHTLIPAPIRQFSATQTIVLEAGDLSVTIPAGSLVNAAGQVVTGTVLISAATYGPRTMPGDFTAVNLSGREVALESVGAFFIGATTPDGQPVNLGRDRVAQVTLRVPQAAGGRMPPCVAAGTCRVAAWRFNASNNRWVEQRANLRPASATTTASTFTLIGGPAATPGSPLTTNGGLGTWNIDLEMDTPACTIVQFVGFPAYCYDFTMNLAMQNANNTYVPSSDTVPQSVPYVVLYNNRPGVDQEVGIQFPSGAPADCGDNMTIFSSPNPTNPPTTTSSGGFVTFNAGPPWGGTGFPNSTVSPYGDIVLADVVNGDHNCSVVTFIYN
ncbi:carboxypeptidase-like regulatory domain-containing protein [Pyxidicoccus xibeiensis]|uniref:carboxypeptidase-like regulatory domain-containing protein n=1 Tax=Pyxidicoccus xibeiensis TaxID=2906759 RepID=UPI0020A81D81|nr:carboxypeptidase-like regulatory domain-containing protein [Pyxidicoccus xibeiensis]MCP3140350.1 carboxypeptidase-like regulatory domain-containing protein [Pyxidicoccus xibeiensis]